MMPMAKTSLPLSQVYRLIEPGPVVLVSTMSGKQANIMTMSWHMMIDFEPPILACVISNRDYTSGIMKKTKECVSTYRQWNLLKKSWHALSRTLIRLEDPAGFTC